jgi:predicted RNA binding protein YcfA (HicA-like mRNA interferase family)
MEASARQGCMMTLTVKQYGFTCPPGHLNDDLAHGTLNNILKQAQVKGEKATSLPH